jgi:hypothetical protein
MDLSERMMTERYELGYAREDAALRTRGALSVGLLMLLLTATAGVLLIALIQSVDGWSHFVVIGMLLVTVAGLMIAISPNRRS